MSSGPAGPLDHPPGMRLQILSSGVVGRTPAREITLGFQSIPLTTRARRRTAAATGAAPPAVNNDFGPGGPPRPSARHAVTPPRSSRPRPRAPVVWAPAPAASSVPTVPIPSDRDRAEPLGTPLLRLLPPTDAPPVTATDLDALGAAVEFQLGDSAAH